MSDADHTPPPGDLAYRHHFGAALDEGDTFHLIIGSDFGRLIEWVVRSGLPAGSRCLFIEPPEVLVRARPGLRALLAGAPQVGLCAAGEWLGRARQMGLDSYAMVERVRLHSALATGQPSAYAALEHTVRVGLDELRREAARHLHMEVPLTCQIFNLPELHVPAQVLEGACVGRSALILAGGPSLDAALPWVRANREHFVLLAISRVARALLQAAVVPDIVVTVAPEPVSFDLSREMLSFPPEVLLVAASHAYPPLLGQWRGPIAYLGPRCPWPSALNPANLAPAGSTATEAALGLAVAMGCRRAIFAGLDLCYSPEGYSHASGSSEYLAGPRPGFSGHPVRTNDGHLAATSDAFLYAIDDLARQAGAARARGCTPINTAAGAARIDHIDFVPLAQLDLDPRDPPAGERLRALVPPLDQAQRQAHYRAVIAELTQVAGRLRGIRNLAARALRCNEGLFGRGGGAPDFRYKRLMDRIEQRLDSRYADLTAVVKLFAIARFARLIGPVQAREPPPAQVEALGRDYYGAYLRGVERLLGRVEKAGARAADRLAEEDDTPDLATLIPRWREADEPGRGEVWRLRHRDQAARLPLAVAGALDWQRAQFLRAVNSEDTPHLRRCRAAVTLDGTAAAARRALAQGDAPRLRSLQRGLARFGGDEAEQLQRLVRGYLLENDGRGDEALAEYALIDRPELLEDSLGRIVALTLEFRDHANALRALECLCQVSYAYLPQYADLLRVSGRQKEAVDALARYLDHAPHDYAAVLKVGEIYRDTGVTEGAIWAFNYVLERDPDNESARRLLEGMRDGPQDHGDRRGRPGGDNGDRNT